MSRFMSTTGNTSGYARVPTAEMQSPINADDERSVADAENAGTEETSLPVAVPQQELLIPVPHTRAYNYMQTRGCYPGFAFCKFLPGKFETIIRSLLMVVLVVLIGLSDSLASHNYNFGAKIIFLTAPVGLTMEGIMMLLHFLNPSCFNNHYNIFGAMDMIKCAAIGLFISFGYVQILFSDLSCDYEDRQNNCEGASASRDNSLSEDCYQSLIILDWTIVFITLCLILLLIVFIWDTIYVSRHFKSKVPVPRSRPGQHQ